MFYINLTGKNHSYVDHAVGFIMCVFRYITATLLSELYSKFANFFLKSKFVILLDKENPFIVHIWRYSMFIVEVSFQNCCHVAIVTITKVWWTDICYFYYVFWLFWTWLVSLCVLLNELLKTSRKLCWNLMTCTRHAIKPAFLICFFHIHVWVWEEDHLRILCANAVK